MELNFNNLFSDSNLQEKNETDVVNHSGIFVPVLNDTVYIEGDAVPDGVKAYTNEEINILFSLDENAAKLCHSMKQAFNGNISLQEIIKKVNTGEKL